MQPLAILLLAIENTMPRAAAALLAILCFFGASGLFFYVAYRIITDYREGRPQ